MSDSRVYAGIHWRFDVQAGQVMGNQVGDYIVTHFLLPASRSDDAGGEETWITPAGTPCAAWAGGVTATPAAQPAGPDTTAASPPASSDREAGSRKWVTM